MIYASLIINIYLKKKCQQQCSVIGGLCSSGCASWGTNGAQTSGVQIVRFIILFINFVRHDIYL